MNSYWSGTENMQKCGMFKQENMKGDRMPDAFAFQDGSRVCTKADWEKRRKEIAGRYEDCMYGPMRSGEMVRFESQSELTIGRFHMTDPNDFRTLRYTETKEAATDTRRSYRIYVKTNETEASFCINMYLPTVACTRKNGAPAVIEIGMLQDAVREYLLSEGYATIEFQTGPVASDDAKHEGAFYTLYPYGDSMEQQTGVLMAWAWGVSKIIDFLELPKFRAEGRIDPEILIVNGVSRNGKAAAVAGAFDQRIRITVPSSSGAGGMAAFRYGSEGLTFDYSPLLLADFQDVLGEEKGQEAWESYQTEEKRFVTVTTNQSFLHLGHDSGGGWVNEKYKSFQDVSEFPLDQHLLAALCAGEKRFCYITTEVVGGDWVNAAATYATYLETRKIYAALGLADHLAIRVHAIGHAFTRLDAMNLVSFCEEKVYHQTQKTNQSNLSGNCIYEENENRTVFDTVYRKIETEYPLTL